MKNLNLDHPFIVHSVTVIIVLLAVAAIVLVASADNAIVSLVIR